MATFKASILGTPYESAPSRKNDVVTNMTLTLSTPTPTLKTRLHIEKRYVNSNTGWIK